MGRVVIFIIAFAIAFSISAEEYKKVEIQFLSALIGPSKVNGKSWDTTNAVSSSGMSVISEMILPGSGIPVKSVISAVNTIAAQGAAAPDIVGYVVQTGPTTRELAPYAGIPLALATPRNKTQDSYTPRFYAGYSGWPIFEDTRFQLQMWDKDLVNNDQVAVIEIGKKEIEEAIKEGKPTWINVSDQSMNQVLFILISASESLSTNRPKMNGGRWN